MGPKRVKYLSAVCYSTPYLNAIPMAVTRVTPVTRVTVCLCDSETDLNNALFMVGGYCDNRTIYGVEYHQLKFTLTLNSSSLSSVDSKMFSNFRSR